MVKLFLQQKRLIAVTAFSDQFADSMTALLHLDGAEHVGMSTRLASMSTHGCLIVGTMAMTQL